MASLTDAMSASTCATVAQIAPVFLVALVAERIVFRASPSPVEQRKRIAIVLIRVVIDGTIAVSLLLLTLLAVAGVEADGLTGQSARSAWYGFVLLAIAVIYRWLIVSTPLLPFLNAAAQWWAERVAQAIFQIVEWITGLIGRAVLPSFWTFISQVISIALDIVVGVLTVGFAGPINSVASLLSTRARRNDAGPPADSSRDQER